MRRYLPAWVRCTERAVRNFRGPATGRDDIYNSVSKRLLTRTIYSLYYFLPGPPGPREIYKPLKVLKTRVVRVNGLEKICAAPYQING